MSCIFELFISENTEGIRGNGGMAPPIFELDTGWN